MRAGNAADGEAQLRELLLRHLVCGVSRRHVADFVPHHGRELGFVRDMRENAARHIHVPARNRERIHAGVIDDAEGPWQVGPLGRRREACDVVLERGVGVEADRRHNFAVVQRAHLDFLALADEHQLVLASRGIPDARDREQQRKSAA